MNSPEQLTINIFADGADIETIKLLNHHPLVKGFTTNPTLMKKAGVVDYGAFANEVIALLNNKPISFEVFADNFDEMEHQALKIASWGENVYVKIPITNTKGESSAPLIKKLSAKGIRLNVTAIFTFGQVKLVLNSLTHGVPAYVSVFAGRVADTGCDPLPLMKDVVGLLRYYNNVELIWASTRELFNIVQADQIGCHIITVTHDLLKKLALVGKNHEEFSLETVKTFYKDANVAGYEIDVNLNN
jgi:transaldolase